MSSRSLTVIAGLAVLAAGCGSAPTPAARVQPVSAPSALPPSAAATPAARKPVRRPAPADPLTGLAVTSSPVVVIKVDNATTARPYQRGLGAAAIIYQELVESGQTRFAAVFDNGYTGEVGPIRSVRESDIELLSQYGRVAVAFSGGNSGVKASFSRAVQAGQLLDASYDATPGRYRLGEQRVDARNFFASPAALAAGRSSARSRNIGLVFGPLKPTAGQPVRAATMAFSGTVTVSVRYNSATGRWAVLQDGVAVPGVAPANIIVQSVAIQNSRYVDVLGAPTPYTISTGSGNALVLRDGRALHANWRRLGVSTGTRYLDDKGRDLPLKPGPTWVLLLPKSRSASFG